MEKRLEGLRIWMWQYSRESRHRNYVQFMATPESWDVLIQSLKELRDDQHRTVPLRQLRVEHDPTGFRDSFAWFSKLRVEVTRQDPELFQMNVSTDGDTVMVTLHPDFMSEFLETLQNVREGGWDFGFGPETRKKSKWKAGARDRSSLWLMFWQPIRGTV